MSLKNSLPGFQLDGQTRVTGWPFRSTGWPIGHPVNMLGEALLCLNEVSIKKKLTTSNHFGGHVLPDILNPEIDTSEKTGISTTYYTPAAIHTSWT